MIKDLQGQVKLALNEVSNRYTKGMTFRLTDLLSVISCQHEGQYSVLKSLISNELQSKRIAHQAGFENGEKIFRKF